MAVVVCRQCVYLAANARLLGYKYMRYRDLLFLPFLDTSLELTAHPACTLRFSYTR